MMERRQGYDKYNYNFLAHRALTPQKTDDGKQYTIIGGYSDPNDPDEGDLEFSKYIKDLVLLTNLESFI